MHTCLNQHKQLVKTTYIVFLKDPEGIVYIGHKVNTGASFFTSLSNNAKQMDFKTQRIKP